jgi:hypothetical protein
VRREAGPSTALIRSLRSQINFARDDSFIKCHNILQSSIDVGTPPGELKS